MNNLTVLSQFQGPYVFVCNNVCQNSFIEVEVAFDRSSYSANEGDDSVEVCIRVSRGSIQRTIQVTVNTEDGTATGSF